jgi:hypothetical protein
MCCLRMQFAAGSAEPSLHRRSVWSLLCQERALSLSSALLHLTSFRAETLVGVKVGRWVGMCRHDGADPCRFSRGRQACEGEGAGRQLRESTPRYVCEENVGLGCGIVGMRSTTRVDATRVRWCVIGNGEYCSRGHGATTVGADIDGGSHVVDREEPSSVTAPGTGTAHSLSWVLVCVRHTLPSPSRSWGE